MSTEKSSSKKRSRGHSEGGSRRKRRSEKSKHHSSKKTNESVLEAEQKVLDTLQQGQVDVQDAEIKKPRRTASEAKKKAMQRQTISDLWSGKDAVRYITTLFKKIQCRCEGSTKPSRIVTKDAIKMLDNLRDKTLEIFLTASVNNKPISNLDTFNCAQAMSAIRLTMPGTCTNAAITRGSDAVTKYKSSRAIDAAKNADERRRQMVESRTGLILKVSITNKKVRDVFNRVSAEAVLAMSAAAEVIQEIIALLTIEYVEMHKPQKYGRDGQPVGGLNKITARDVMNAVCAHKGQEGNHADNGLAHFFRDVVWTKCGKVIPEKFVEVVA